MLVYFLVRDHEGGEGSAQFGGDNWRLVGHELETSGVDDGTSFICISYTWGLGTEPSPFHPSFNISDRTIPALNAVVSRRPSCDRIWVDAFCVPITAPARNQTLESMGYIYSKAEEVVVVLSRACHAVLKQMNSSDRITTEHLDILEKEPWVSRAWTYQEAVNSRYFSITCEGDTDDSFDVAGIHFLNCLGITLDRVKRANSFSYVRTHYPFLDAFEDLLLDVVLGENEGRSALQIMVNMDRRCAHYPQDLFYAMMGAITTNCSSFGGPLDPCEAFMSVCESKGDYSFIYSAAKRDTTPGRRWRPVAGSTLLSSILPSLPYGRGQPGHEDSQSKSFYLDQVMALDIRPLEDNAKLLIKSWLTEILYEFSIDAPIATSAHGALEAIGFKGSASALETTHGLFFPAEAVFQPDEDVTILVATEIKWTLGAPGLARCRRGSGDTESYTYIPGVFAGRIDSEAATSVKVS